MMTTLMMMTALVALCRVYDFDTAQDLYKLVRASPIKDLRQKARALSLGAEAMKKLGLGSKSKVNPRYMVSFPYIPGQMEDR
jgi:hypothetical protein